MPLHSILDKLRSRFENFADRFRRYRRPLERAQRAIEKGRWRTAYLELESAYDALLRSHPDRQDLLMAVEDARFRTAFLSEDDQLIDAEEGLNASRPLAERSRYLVEQSASRELGDELLDHRKHAGAARLGDALQRMQPETAARNYLIARLWLPSRTHAADVEQLLNRIDRLGSLQQSSLARVTRARFLAGPESDEAQWKRARAVLEPLKPWSLLPEARLVYARVMLTSWRSIRRVRALDALNFEFSDAGQRRVAVGLIADFIQNPPASMGVIEVDRVAGAMEKLHREDEPESQKALDALTRWQAARQAQRDPAEELEGDEVPWKRAAREFLAGRSFNESRPEEGPGRWAMEAMTLARSFDAARCEALAREMMTSGRLGPGARGSAALGILSPLVPHVLEQFDALPEDGRSRELVRMYVERTHRPGYGFWRLAQLAAKRGVWEVAAACVIRGAREAGRGGDPIPTGQESWCAAAISKAAAERIQRGELGEARQLLERWREITDLLAS